MSHSRVTSVRVAAVLSSCLLAAARSRAAGFFDGVPGKGYVVDDVSLDALSATGGSGPVARLRHLRLSLDPGRRDVAVDFWRGRVRLEKGPFAGEDWDRLRSAATGELGKR